MTEPLLPRRLQPGDTVGIIHPAGPVQNIGVFKKGVQILREFGLQVRHCHPDGSGPDYLAAGDDERVREIHSLWADEEVKALMAARGGYGCLRIMAELDLVFLRSHPKLLIGFSDLTVLLNGIYAQAGLVTLHGPVVTTLPRLKPVFMERFKEQLHGVFRECTAMSGLEILQEGIGRGRLIGGNLTTLTHLIGTPWQPQFAGNILFLEDTKETPYKLDRMLTHLFCCGLLDNLSGLILGIFDPGHDDRLEMIRLNEQVWNRVLELTAFANYPIWGGFPVGHQESNHPLPIGMTAVMDSSTGTLDFLPQQCLCADTS